MKEDDHKDRHARQPENNVAEHRTTPLLSGGAAAIADHEPCWNTPVAVLPAPDHRPPSCTKGDDQSGGRNEARQQVATVQKRNVLTQAGFRGLTNQFPIASVASITLDPCSHYGRYQDVG
jgi:hypothetical protein